MRNSDDENITNSETLQEGQIKYRVFLEYIYNIYAQGAIDDPVFSHPCLSKIRNSVARLKQRESGWISCDTWCAQLLLVLIAVHYKGDLALKFGRFGLLREMTWFTWTNDGYLF